jgi:hypothetical protein
MFWGKKDKKEEPRQTQASMSQARKEYAEIEQKSDWIKHILEMKKLDVIPLLRQPPNPQHTYLLFHDGKYQGTYSAKRPLNTADVLLNQYVIYETDLNRRRLEYEFHAPVADAPDKTIKLTLKIKADILGPEVLIEKGIWNIKSELETRLEQIVRDVSGRYKGAARAECEADLKRQIEGQEFDIGIRMIDISVARDVPNWVMDKLREENEARRRADDDQKRKQEEVKRKQEEEKERMRKVREAQQLKAEQAKAEAARKAEDRAYQLEQEKDMQRFKQELSHLLREKDALPQIKARAAAEKDPARRRELEKLAAELIEYDRKERELAANQASVDWQREKERQEREATVAREAERLRQDREIHDVAIEFEKTKNELYDLKSKVEINQIADDRYHQREMQAKAMEMERLEMVMQRLIEGGVLSGGLLSQGGAVADIMRLLLQTGGVQPTNQVNISVPPPAALENPSSANRGHLGYKDKEKPQEEVAEQEKDDGVIYNPGPQNQDAETAEEDEIEANLDNALDDE